MEVSPIYFNKTFHFVQHLEFTKVCTCYLGIIHQTLSSFIIHFDTGEGEEQVPAQRTLQRAMAWRSRLWPTWGGTLGKLLLLTTFVATQHLRSILAAGPKSRASMWLGKIRSLQCFFKAVLLWWWQQNHQVRKIPPIKCLHKKKYYLKVILLNSL